MAGSMFPATDSEIRREWTFRGGGVGGFRVVFAAMCAGWAWLLALLSGFLLTLCFAPFGWGDVCWLALTPLIVGVWFSKPSMRWNRLRLFGAGFLCGVGYFGGSLSWLATLTVPGWILLALYLSVYPGVWAVFLGTVARPDGVDRSGRPVWLSSLANLRVCALGAAAWVGLEWLRGVLFTGFGWNGLGVALNKNIPLIQIADVTGVGGISFLVVMANLMAVATVKRLLLEVGRGARRPHYDFALTIALIVVAWSYGLRQLMAPPAESVPVTIAAVQANVPQSVRNDPEQDDLVMDKYRRHTETAIAMGPDLILWPESAPPRPVFNDQRMWDFVRGLAEEHDGDFLLGTTHYSELGDFNSVVLLTDHGRGVAMQHKMHLVPFGEYVPLRRVFPLFAWVVGDLVPDDFDAGAYAVVFEMATRPVKLGALVCFEDTLGDLAREFVLLGAQAFAVVTNDGWFLESAGSRQHLENAIFRCAENKVPMVRAANTGVTCVVDRFGAVREELRDEKGSTFIEGVLFSKMDVPKSVTPTFYARYGEIFSLLCLAVAVPVAFLGWFRTRRGKDSACPEPPDQKTSTP